MVIPNLRQLLTFYSQNILRIVIYSGINISSKKIRNVIDFINGLNATFFSAIYDE